MTYKEIFELKEFIPNMENINWERICKNNTITYSCSADWLEDEAYICYHIGMFNTIPVEDSKRIDKMVKDVMTAIYDYDYNAFKAYLDNINYKNILINNYAQVIDNTGHILGFLNITENTFHLIDEYFNVIQEYMY